MRGCCSVGILVNPNQASDTVFLTPIRMIHWHYIKIIYSTKHVIWNVKSLNISIDCFDFAAWFGLFISKIIAYELIQFCINSRINLLTLRSCSSLKDAWYSANITVREMSTHQDIWPASQIKMFLANPKRKKEAVQSMHSLRQCRNRLQCRGIQAKNILEAVRLVHGAVSSFMPGQIAS